MAAEHSLESIALKMRGLKLEALAKGDLTDFSFLVGTEKSTAQLVHCFKSDLVLASEYFQGLIRSGDSCPVHIKRVKPHIFKMLIRFISLLDLEGTSKLEDFVLLALAADEFLMEPLRDLCRFEIEKLVTVKNVWLTLNSICLVPKIAAACTKVLATETSKCLQHPSFLQASKDSLIYLLQMDVLQIKSELELLNACLRLANSRPEKEGFELMRAALPHLRLMTLPPDKFSRLTEYLTAEERTYLAGNLFFKDKNVSCATPPSLNKNTTPRSKATYLTFYELIPENFITKRYSQMSGQKLDSQFGYPWTKFLCEFTLPEDSFLKGLEILTRVNNKPGRCAASDMEYDEDLSINLLRTTDGMIQCVHGSKIQGKKPFNSWFYYAFDEDIVFIRGSKCTIQIYPMNGAAYLPIADFEVMETYRAAKWAAAKMDFNPQDSGWYDVPKQNYIVKSATFDSIN